MYKTRQQFVKMLDKIVWIEKRAQLTEQKRTKKK